MIPAIAGAFGHFGTNTLDPTEVGKPVFEQVPISVIAAFHLAEDVLRYWKPTFFVHIRHVVNIMHVHDESAHFLRNFRFGFLHVVHNLTQR